MTQHLRSGNPAKRARAIKEQNAPPTSQTSTFEYDRFKKELRTEAQTTFKVVFLLFAAGLALPFIIGELKLFDYIRADSVVGSVHFTPLFESMFSSEVPLIFGCIMFAAVIMAFSLKDSVIKQVMRLFNAIFVTSFGALIATVILIAGMLLKTADTTNNMLTMVSMLANYGYVLLLSVIGLFFTAALLKNPNKGTNFQYFCLLLGFVLTSISLFGHNTTNTFKVGSGIILGCYSDYLGL